MRIDSKYEFDAPRFKDFRFVSEQVQSSHLISNSDTDDSWFEKSHSEHEYLVQEKLHCNVLDYELTSEFNEISDGECTSISSTSENKSSITISPMNFPITSPHKSFSLENVSFLEDNFFDSISPIKKLGSPLRQPKRSYDTENRDYYVSVNDYKTDINYPISLETDQVDYIKDEPLKRRQMMSRSPLLFKKPHTVKLEDLKNLLAAHNARVRPKRNK